MPGSDDRTRSAVDPGCAPGRACGSLVGQVHHHRGAEGGHRLDEALVAQSLFGNPMRLR